MNVLMLCSLRFSSSSAVGDAYLPGKEVGRHFYLWNASSQRLSPRLFLRDKCSGLSRSLVTFSLLCSSPQSHPSSGKEPCTQEQQRATNRCGLKSMCFLCLFPCQLAPASARFPRAELPRPIGKSGNKQEGLKKWK